MSLTDGIEKFVKPVVKLIELVGRGVGVWYEPIHIQKMAEASKVLTDSKEYEINKIAKVIETHPELQINYDDGKVLMNNEHINNLIADSKKRVMFMEVKNQNNIERVIGNASLELENIDEVPDIPIDQDWIYRFFDYAKGISNEEMQKAWGRILAGEIKSPGTFSLRTLETIKNMSQEEALLFNKLSKFVISTTNDKILFDNTTLFSKFGLSVEQLMILEDCGLVKINDSINFNLRAEKNYLFYGTKIVVIDKPITIKVLPITQSGKQILSILNPEYEYDYLYKEMCGLEGLNTNNIEVHETSLGIGDGSLYQPTDLLKEYKEKNNIIT